MEFIFPFPSWFIIFCIALGGLYAFTLYYKTKDFANDSKQQNYYNLVLAALRFFTVTILSFLLLSPFIKRETVERVAPTIVFVHDNSASVLQNFSTEDSSQYFAKLNKELAAINENYAIDYYSFDESIRENDTLDFKGGLSNLSDALEYVNGIYQNQHVGAVIFASDGIYNVGSNPQFNEFQFPLLSIGLGDTMQQKDVKILQVKHNKIAYLDDIIQVQVDLQAFDAINQEYELKLYEKGTLLNTKSQKINSDYDERTIDFEIKANSVGIHHYTFELNEIDNESNVLNNIYDCYIEVIDNRQKILLIAQAPHPDIAAIKSVVEQQNNFEITIQYANQYNANVDDYSLVILHQLPSINANFTGQIKQIQDEQIPIWFISGVANNYAQLSTTQQIVNITTQGNSSNDVTPIFNNSFNAFTLSDNTIEQLKKWPPLQIPFGDFKNGINTKTCLLQKIGTVNTDFPLLSFQDNFNTRNAMFIGDGLWRWKMYEFEEKGQTLAFNEIIKKTITYLALKGDKRQFKMFTNKNSFTEGETIYFEAELYNDNYELINSPAVNFVVSNENGEEYPFTMNKTKSAYDYQVNSLPTGNYNYVGEVVFNGKKQTAEGAFTIKKAFLEATQTKANHQLLRQLSNNTNGHFMHYTNVEDLSEYLLGENQLSSKLFERNKTQSIINIPWIFGLLLLLLSIEWFTRKFWGAY